MKKVKYLLVTLLAFFFCFKVNALTNNGKLYEIFWGNAGVNVFASDTTYNSMDYNGWMVVSSTDNYVYYCIEPETYMQNSGDATYNTHTSYIGKNSIIDNSRLDSNTYNVVSLLAYYGYGYKDHLVDHTSKYWYGITQVMIWRVLRPDINYVFKDSRYGNINTNLYQAEVQEMNNLVNKHYVKASFDNTTITMKKGETIVLEDTNNVIGSYLESTDIKADYTITGNQLIITAKEEKTINPVFSKPNVEANFMLYKSTSLQDIITRGDIFKPNIHLIIHVESKDITIKKVDSETGLFNDKLIGSVFGLYDENDHKIQEIEITKEQEVITLGYGKYYLKELTASPGYALNDKVYDLEVNADSNNLEVVIENELIKGSLELTKVDYASDVPLEGVLLSVYKADDTLIYTGKTDINGKMVVTNLLMGDYYIKEEETIKYYRLNLDTITFSINENKEVVKKVMTNQRKEGTLEFLKVDKDSQVTLSDALIEIYFKETNELVFKGKTDEFGKISLSTLVAGTYYLKEVEAPYSYLLNKELIEFEIVEENEIVEVTMEDEKIEIPNTFATNNLVFYLLFSGVFIAFLLLKEKHEKNN